MLSYLTAFTLLFWPYSGGDNLNSYKKDFDYLFPIISIQEKVKKNPKIEAYNINSDKVVGNRPQKAVEKSPALVACSEVPDKCYPKKEVKNETPPPVFPTKIPETTNIPTPTLVPTFAPVPTGIIITPYPTEYPCQPPPCGRPILLNGAKFIKDCPIYIDNESALVMPCVYLEEAM